MTSELDTPLLQKASGEVFSFCYDRVMSKRTNSRRTLVLSLVVVIAGAGIAGWLLFGHSGKTISAAESNRVCQNFYNEVESNIKAQPGYAILDSYKSCNPDTDEGGNTDYYFSAQFRLSKAGNETPAGIKANSKRLADNYPKTDYPIWVRNDASVGGQPQTICFEASMQIQENGDVYSAYPHDHYSDYTEPGSLPDYNPCYKLASK